MQDSKQSRIVVRADGTGLVSRAGVALLRELTFSTGLGTGWSTALLDTYSGIPAHLPGRVLADLAVSIADGGDALTHLATLRDQDKLFGSVASDATAWRVLYRAFITDTVGGRLAELEVHHRSHARVEDRIRCGKATGLRNLPCRDYTRNKAWLEAALTAADLLNRTRRCVSPEISPAANRRPSATASAASPRNSPAPPAS